MDHADGLAPANVEKVTPAFGQWQPIETAPKDGTHIIAYNRLVGVYHTAFTTRWTGEPFEAGYAGFPCGFWHRGERSYPFGKWDCQPTHWMPLPTAPDSDDRTAIPTSA